MEFGHHFCLISLLFHVFLYSYSEEVHLIDAIKYEIHVNVFIRL